MKASSSIQSNPLRVWLKNLTEQEMAIAQRTKRVEREIHALHKSLAQITVGPESGIKAKKIALPSSALSLELKSKIESQAERLSSFLSRFIQGKMIQVDKKETGSLMKRSNELLKLLNEFNMSEYESLNDFLLEEFPQLHQSQEILELQSFIQRAAIQKLPKSITRFDETNQAKLLKLAQDIHILLFDTRLDTSIANSLFDGSFSKSYKFWINELEKFFESEGAIISESLKSELGPSFREWQGLLVYATLLNTLKLSANDPKKYPLKDTLEKRFNLLNILQGSLDEQVVDNSIIQSVIDDFNSEKFDSETYEPEIEFSEYMNRLYPGLEETFDLYRINLIQNEMQKLCVTLLAKPNSDILELTNDLGSSSSGKSEEELLKEILPRIYTLVTKQRMRSEDAAKNVDEFLQVKPSKDRLLENRLEAFLKCNKIFLKELTPLIMGDLPQIITKLIYESIIHEGLEIKGFEMDRLVEFINRLDNLKYDLQPSMPQA